MGTSIYPVPYSGIQETTIDAKGDLLVGTAADAISRLAVGTNTYVLTADSAEATGLKWAAASSGALPTFSAYRSGSNQSFSASIHTKVQINTEDWDTASCFDSTTNYRFTPTTSGYYQINALAGFDASTLSEVIVEIYKNGSKAAWLTYEGNTGNSAPTYSGGMLLYLNGSTDYIEMYVYAVGTGLNISYGATTTIFSAIGIRS